MKSAKRTPIQPITSTILRLVVYIFHMVHIYYVATIENTLKSCCFFHKYSILIQLSTASDSGEMQPFPPNDVHDSFSDAQAILEDYSNIVDFERGHLNPDEHQAHPDDKAATYTLTNVVPQIREFNVGHWKQHEHIIRRRLNNYCRGKAYIITGVTTSGRMIRRYNINRVAVPTYLWSAYCCIDYDHNAPFDERSKFPAFAAYGLNEKEGAEVIEMSVQQLEDFLKKNTFVDKRFQIFFGNCEPNEAIMKVQT